MSRRRAVALAVTAGLLAAACAPRSVAPTTTMVPLVPRELLPTTTAAPTTTLLSNDAPATALLEEIPELECAFTPPLAGGEITFVVGDRLFSVGSDGTQVRCITQLDESQRGVVRWSPTGARAVVNSATVFDDQGSRETGFRTDNTRVRWVFPAGDALIAPTSTNNTLVRREAATAARSEVTFLWQTELAISHPAGNKLIASGLSPDAERGVFVAGPDGSDRRTAALIAEDDTTVVDLAVDAGGTELYVVTTDLDRYEIRRLTFPGLTLSDVDSDQEPIGDLTPGPVTKTLAWKVGLCNSTTTTRVLDDRSGQPVTVGDGGPLDGLSVGPVGWLDASRLVVISRPLGCSGPGDLWIWNALDGSAVLLTRAVEFPAVRVGVQRATYLSITPDVAIPEL